MGKGVDKSGGQITVLYELTLHRIINRTRVKGSRSTDHAFAQLAKEGFDSNQNNKTKTDHENVTKPRLWRKYGHDNGKKNAISTDRAFVQLAKADTKTTTQEKKKGHRTNPIATTPQHPRPFSLCFYVRRNGTIARVKPSSRLCTYQKVANISDFWICREMSRFSLYFRSVFFYIAHQSFLQYTFHIFPKIRFSISDLLFLIFLIRLSYISNQIGTIFCKTTAVGPPTSAG